MWIGRKLKQLASRSSASILPAGYSEDSIRNNQYFTRIDNLLKEATNVIEFRALEWLIKQTSVSPDECVTLTHVLMYKLNGYRESNRRGRKMFKTLVIVDFIILNAVSVFIDLFQEYLLVFELIAGTESQPQNPDKQFEELIVRKAAHICNILKDKQLRISEKQYLQRARMHLALKNKENLYNSQEQISPTTSFPSGEEAKSRFEKIQSFINDKLERFAIALIGLIDEDMVLYINSEGNKDFMEKGESIFDPDLPDRQKAEPADTSSPIKENTEEKQQQSKEQPKAEPERTPQLENLLELDIELL